MKWNFDHELVYMLTNTLFPLKIYQNEKSLLSPLRPHWLLMLFIENYKNFLKEDTFIAQGLFLIIEFYSETVAL